MDRDKKKKKKRTLMSQRIEEKGDNATKSLLSHTLQNDTGHSPGYNRQIL